MSASSQTGTIVALATFSLLAPAAFSPLGAGAPAEPPIARPPVQTLELDDATVEVGVDRALVEPGGTVRVTLVATAESPRPLALRVEALEQRGEPMGRVMTPPRSIAAEDIELVAEPGGGKPRLVSFTLKGRGDGGDRLLRAGMVQPHTIMVQALTGEGKARRVAPDAAAVVMVGVQTPEAYRVELDVPAMTPAGATFEAVLRVRNPTGKTLRDVNVELAAGRQDPDGFIINEDAVADDVTIEPVDAEGGYLETLAPGEERAVRFKVTPGAGLRATTLSAWAYAGYGGRAHAERAIAVTAPAAVALAQAAAN